MHRVAETIAALRLIHVICLNLF